MADGSQRFSFNLAAKGHSALRQQIVKIRQMDPLAESMSYPDILAYLARVGAKREIERLQRNRKRRENQNERGRSTRPDRAGEQDVDNKE